MTYIDQYTKLLIHADGTEGSNSFTDFSPSGHSITATASKTFTFTRPDGEDIGEGWIKGYSGTSEGSITIVDNKVRLSNQGNINEYRNSTIKSNFELSGNFDVQISYFNLNLGNPTTNQNDLLFQLIGYTTAGGSNFFYISIVKNSSYFRYEYGCSVDGVFSSGVLGNTPVASGALRISRVGSVFTGYIWDGATWVQHIQVTGWSGNVKHIRPEIRCYYSDANVTVDLDNFQINSGTVVNYPSPTVSTATKKFGTGSAYFGGDVSYLSIPDSDDWNFGSGDFTIDFWVNFTAANNLFFFNQRYDADNFHELKYRFTTNELIWSSYSNYSEVFTLNKTIVLNIDTWYHIGAVRFGNIFRIFINGEQLGTDVVKECSLPNLSCALDISRRSFGDNYLNGYIDELRVSKGIARWTENFTPPGAAYRWPMIGGTLAEDATIMVIKEVDYTKESANSFLAGEYEIECSDTNSRLIFARKTDGEIEAYGNVIPQ